MRSIYVLLPLLQLFLLLVHMITGEEALTFPKKITVQITNTLEGNGDLKVHCKSKNDDLGEHILRHGEAYQFKFKRDFFKKSTLFFCSFRWPGAPRLYYFDIYREDRDGCSKCFWTVKKVGPCYYDQCYLWHDSQGRQ